MHQAGRNRRNGQAGRSGEMDRQEETGGMDRQEDQVRRTGRKKQAEWADRKIR
jgi:hypothetical protein